MIHHPQRNVAPAAEAIRDQNGPNAAHLIIVRCAFHAQEQGFSKAGNAGKTYCGQEKEEETFERKRIDAYENHIYYVFYKQRSCQVRWTDFSDRYRSARYDADRLGAVRLRLPIPLGAPISSRHELDPLTCLTPPATLPESGFGRGRKRYVSGRGDVALIHCPCAPAQESPVNRVALHKLESLSAHQSSTSARIDDGQRRFGSRNAKITVCLFYAIQPKAGGRASRQTSNKRLSYLTKSILGRTCPFTSSRSTKMDWTKARALRPRNTRRTSAVAAI